jgi:hypothetical protein
MFIFQVHLLQWQELVLGQEMFSRRGHGYEFDAVFPKEADWG